MSKNPLRPLLDRCNVGFTIGQKLLLILGGLVYLISPIDILPDVIPVAGWIDDAMLLYTLVRVVFSPTLSREDAKGLAEQTQRR